MGHSRSSYRVEADQIKVVKDSQQISMISFLCSHTMLEVVEEFRDVLQSLCGMQEPQSTGILVVTLCLQIVLLIRLRHLAQGSGDQVCGFILK